MTEEERAKAKAKDNYDIEARRSHWDTDFIDWDDAAKKTGVTVGNHDDDKSESDDDK